MMRGKSVFKKISKKEPVLVIAAFCAAISIFFVPPSSDYIEYIDWKVLSLLFCLLAVISGFQECGLFHWLGYQLLEWCNKMRSLRFVLIMLPFFSSMLITNDVALITFVPFAILVLNTVGRKEELIFIVVLQTIAANLGSMAMPVGNPQSLFLYNHYGITAQQYFQMLLPLVLVSFIALTVASSFRKNDLIPAVHAEKSAVQSPKKLMLFGFLFLLCMLCVLHWLDYHIVLAAVLAAMLLFDRPLLRQVDYGLLGTFVCFFLFSGNLGNLPAVRQIITQLLQENTLGTAMITSQVISNVPAAVLLSGFTKDVWGMVVGTNIGGLGTPIASLASLISLKYYLKSIDARPLRYLAVFTAANLIGLALLTIAALFQAGIENV